MTSHPPAISKTQVEAFRASAWRILFWLLGVVLRLAACGRSARLNRELSAAEHIVETLLFVQAVARYGPPPQRRAHPRSTPRGFRRQHTHRLRLFFRGAGVRARKASPLTRVAALIRALAHPERAVAYFFKRICTGLHLARIVAIAPPARAFTRQALMAALAAPDTS